MKDKIILIVGEGAGTYNEMDFNSVEEGLKTPLDFIARYRETGETDFEGVSMDLASGDEYFSVEVTILDLSGKSLEEILHLTQSEMGNYNITSESDYYLQVF